MGETRQSRTVQEIVTQWEKDRGITWSLCQVEAVTNSLNVRIHKVAGGERLTLTLEMLSEMTTTVYREITAFLENPVTRSYNCSAIPICSK